MPYLAEGTPAATHRSPKVVAIGVGVAVCVALAGAGWWTVSGGDDAAAGHHRTQSIRAVPGAASAQASSTTVPSVASTTSLLPKTGLGGRTVAIGQDGRFGATMPARTTQTSTSASATTWSVTLAGGSRLAFTALRSTSIADRYHNSIGRLDPLAYAAQVDADLGVTGRTPSEAAFPAGPGAEWAIVGGGRISVVDAGEDVFVVSLRHAGEVLPSSDFAAYLAVVASIHTP
jgi:hypothetical protein